jgi:hypothetical protein
MFALVFTIGTSFLLFVNGTNLLYSQSLVGRANKMQDRLSEQLLIGTLLTGSHVAFYVNNTGGLNANITAAFVLDTFGNVLKCEGKGLQSPCVNSTPPLPVVVNVGRGSAVMDTGYVYGSGTYTVELVTQRGGTFSATYPPTAIYPPIINAITLGAFGALYLKFDSYTYYRVYSGGGCPSGGANSGYCLSNQGKAFTIANSYVTGNSIAFSVTFTNIDPKQANITLDKYASLIQLWPGPVNGNCAPSSCVLDNNWFIVSNSSNTILKTYSPIVLFYNIPVTVVFATYTPGNFTPNTYFFTSSNAPGVGQLVAVNLYAHGWKATSFSKITGSSPPVGNYGQNSPYVSTLYN